MKKAINVFESMLRNFVTHGKIVCGVPCDDVVPTVYLYICENNVCQRVEGL